MNAIGLPENLPHTLTVKETAAYFNLSTRTIDRSIESGKLKCYKVGTRRRIKREWVMEYEAALIAESLDRYS